MSIPPRAPQADLFSWEPPRVVAAYEPDRVRAASLAASLAKGVSAAMRDCAAPRADIARKISAYLGEAVSPDMLDKYASEAADAYIINVVRFVGLIAVTGDRRLLELIAEPFGWAVIERKYLPAIEYAALLAKRKEIQTAADKIRQSLRKSRTL